MNLTYKNILFSLLFIALQGCAQVKQQPIPRVDQMPDKPAHFEIIDYGELARNFDRTVYDFNAQEPFWPLVWIKFTSVGSMPYFLNA